MKQIIIKDNKLYHTTAIGLWINSGSKNDPFEKEGLHHFLEHIYFKDQIIMNAQENLDKIGILYNAFTSHELTCFLGQANVEDTSALLDFLLKIDNCQLNLSEEEIANEKKVIIEEINYYNSQPFEVLKNITIKSILGPENRYANNIYGTKQTVNNITKVDIENGLQEFHVNKILVISGSVHDNSLFDTQVEESSMTNTFLHLQANEQIENNGRSLWSKFVGKTGQVYYGMGIFIPTEYKHMSQIFLNAIYKNMNNIIREKESLTYRIHQSAMQLNNGNVINLLFQTSLENLTVLRANVKKVWENFISTENLEESLLKELVIQKKLNFIKADNPIGEMKKIALSYIFSKDIEAPTEIPFYHWLLNQKYSEAILVSEDIGLNEDNYIEIC